MNAIFHGIGRLFGLARNLVLFVLFVLLVVVLILPVYFLGRSAFPLDRPEFEGRTVWQVLDAREQRFIERGTALGEGNPATCYQAEQVLMWVQAAPVAMLCGLRSASPSLVRALPMSESLPVMRLGCGKTPANWLAVPAESWRMFEIFLADSFAWTVTASDPVCQIGNQPTGGPLP